MSHEPVRYGDTLIFPASLDPDAVTVVSRLNDAGLESYFVGGCVRDLLVGLLPKDFDVSTAARPRQIRRLFRNSRIIGRRFKLAHVHFGDKVIEVATFRQPPEAADEVEGEDADLLIRRDNVFGTAEEDVIRRDFTINALLYDLRTSEVIDYVGGVEDLRQRVLRTIGDPSVRFAEDPVRMLRAVKFMSRLEMDASPETDAAMHECADLIERSAPPRVLEEIYKLMSCGKANRALAMFQEYGLLDRLLPEIASTWREHPAELAAMGGALDRIDRGQRKLDNSFLLACLFLPAWRARLEKVQGQDPVAIIRDLITPVAMRMSMPRRDVGLVKQMLYAFSRFERPPRSKRFRMKEFLARVMTRRALDLLYVATLAGFIDPELHAEWAQRASDVEADPEATVEAEPREGGRRKRRRGGRRRSRSGGRSSAAADRDDTADADVDGLEAGDAEERGEDESREAGSDGSSTRRRSGRRGRRGGRKRRRNRDPDTSEGPADGDGADDAAPSEAEPATAGAEGGSDETRSAPARKSKRPPRKRKTPRRSRKVATTGKRDAQPERRRETKEPDDQVGPGQRHPEDVEDFFDW
ncbi:MAG: polynucleotide adenylyltransferase PcnB [Planctomycetota bacterium]|jgi:poly(A) polymerase